MAKLKINDHPTVLRHRATDETPTPAAKPVDAAWLRQLALDCGADDVGLVEIGRPALENERKEIASRYPWTRTLLAFVRRMSREPVKSEARSVSNLEFHHKGEQVDHISGEIVGRLEQHGIRAVNPSMGFPMEMSRFPNRIWVVSHKPVAVAAGLGHMGIHRNVIHPKFGNFILLGTVLLDADVSEYDEPIEYNPCLECNLCVAACPVGAISSDGQQFNFTSCFTHNYREFLGGFNDWIEQVVDSKSPLEYRRRVTESETSSFWQSLSFGPNYKSAYCLAVCPAGEEVIGPYLADKKEHLQEVVKPLQNKEEIVYVVAGSDAEAHVKKRFQHKRPKHVGNGLHPRSIRGFLDALPYVFQWNQSEGLQATYHFSFTGREASEATIVISKKTLDVKKGLQGTPDLHIFADSETWIGFLCGERSLVWSLVTRRIRMKGSPRLLVKFGRCFPSAGTKHKLTEDWREPPIAKSLQATFQRNDSTSGKIQKTYTDTVGHENEQNPS